MIQRWQIVCDFRKGEPMRRLLLIPLLFVLCGFANDPPELYELSASSGVFVATALDTNENTFVTVNVPGLKRNSVIDIFANFTITNSANNKTLKVKFGPIGSATNVIFTQVDTNQVGVRVHAQVANRNATGSQVVESDYLFATGSGGIQNTGTTFSVDLSIPWQFVITCQKATGAEACQLENWNYEITP